MTFEIAPAEAENIAGAHWRGVPVGPDLSSERSISSVWGPRPPIRFDAENTSPPFHRGIDIQMPVGTQLYAPDDGWVWRLERQEAGGNVLWLGHGPDYGGAGIPPAPTHITVYMHLRELPDLTVGRAIGRGEPIAVSGNSGKWTTGPHLHFGVWVPSDPANPMGEWVSLDPARFDRLNTAPAWPPEVPSRFGASASAPVLAWLEPTAQALLVGDGRVEPWGDPNIERLRAQGWEAHVVLFEPRRASRRRAA